MAQRLPSLKQLRSWRVYAGRDVTIGPHVRAAVRDAAATRKQSDGATVAWERTAPANLRRACEVRVTAAGTLMIKAASASARFQTDRWLKSGGEAALRASGVKRVKVE